ncbi:MAG: BCCT family transporter [Geminicoccaceae bacterium]
MARAAAELPTDAKPIETDYEIGQDNITLLGLDIHNPVFLISGLTIVAFVFFTLIFQEFATEAFGALRPWLTTQFDFVFMIAMNIFVLFCLILIFTPYGSVRIGGRDARPEYSYLGWFAMLFAAGMGIGLVFYGVLEPVNHTLSPPLGLEAPVDADGNLVPETVAAAQRMGMAATIFHWALHPWAAYAVVALSLALFCYKKGLPLTIRSAFYPLLGERVWGWPGHIIDVLAVFATMAGLATSLGYGAEQASAGLAYLFEIPNNPTTRVLLIVGITAVALISVLRGMDGGVKRLSEINMIMALLLFLFVLLVGPTLSLLSGFVTNITAYVTELPKLSNWIGREDTGYLHGWTTFYWAWWIAWSPFVGMFIARVSKGRTVREFLLCVMIVPSIACVLWMTVFGGTALDQYVTTGYTGVTQTIQEWTPELSLFKMLDQLPLAAVTSAIGIILVMVFFITSSDSGSLVIDTITAGGKIDAPVPQRVFWCCFEGLVAIALLLGGGLASLQAFAIAMGFPFALILVAMCVCIFRGLQTEPSR